MKFSSLKFSNLIEAEKKRKRITNNQVMAIAMGISKQTIENVMNGITVPSVVKLCEIATYLKVDINEFFEYDKGEIQNNIVSSLNPEYMKEKDENPYKLLFEMQKQINDIIIENADLKVENGRLKNGYAPVQDANAG